MLGSREATIRLLWLRRQARACKQGRRCSRCQFEARRRLRAFGVINEDIVRKEILRRWHVLLGSLEQQMRMQKRKRVGLTVSISSNTKGNGYPDRPVSRSGCMWGVKWEQQWMATDVIVNL